MSEGVKIIKFMHYPLKAEWDWRRVMANYYGLVTLVDRAVGEILKALEDSGQAENTVVAYTSDHGEVLGDHQLLGKGVFFEPSARIPLLVRVPWLSGGGLDVNQVRVPVLFCPKNDLMPIRFLCSR